PDWGAEIEAAAEQVAIALQVDQVEVQLALQVGARLSVARDHHAVAFRRPVEVSDVPGTGCELLELAALRCHHEQVVVAAVDVAEAVVLVVKAPDHASDRRTPELFAALGWPRVVDHRIRV